MTRLASLEGLISRREGERLAKLAAAVPDDEAIVELGSYKGRSTAYLASSGHHVYAVDRWTIGGQQSPERDRWGYDRPETLEAFHEQLERVGVADLVTPIVGDTVEVAQAWGEPVGLLFIDADHAEASVRADLEAWEPHCVGVIAFDDYAPRWPGVMRVADALAERRGARTDLTDGLKVVWLAAG